MAVRVNGQVILELAVHRGMLRVPPQRRDEARKDVLNFLIDNAIVDQYLLQLKIAVEPKEIDDHVEKVKKEAAAEKQDFNQVLEKLMITEAELRTEMAGALRWDKFVLKYGTEKVLQDYFKANVEMFNGSRMHARHILISTADGKKEAAAATLTGIKKKIDDEVGQAIAKLPPTADAITREKTRAAVLEQAFSKAAGEYSTCPSKKEGGDLGFFPRPARWSSPSPAPPSPSSLIK